MVSISLARANRVGFWRRDTKNFCYYPPPPLNQAGFWRSRENFCYYPPPLNRDGFWRSRKISATTPPPAESGRLLEITDNFCYYPPPVSCCAPPRLPAPDPPLMNAINSSCSPYRKTVARLRRRRRQLYKTRLSRLSPDT